MASGQYHAFFSHNRIEPMGKGLVVKCGIPCSLNDISITVPRIAKSNIVTNGSGKKEWLLGHESDLRAEIRQAPFPDIDLIEADSSLRDIIKSGNEVKECGLAAAWRPGDSQKSSWLQLKIDSIQGRLKTRLIGKADLFKFKRVLQAIGDG